MNLYRVPVYIGFSIMITGLLASFGVVEISSTYMFSVSIAGFCFAFASFIEDDLYGSEGKGKAKRFTMHALYFIAIFALVSLPTIMGNNIADKLKAISDSTAIASIGIVVASLGLREMIKPRE